MVYLFLKWGGACLTCMYVFCLSLCSWPFSHPATGYEAVRARKTRLKETYHNSICHGHCFVLLSSLLGTLSSVLSESVFLPPSFSPSSLKERRRRALTYSSPSTHMPHPCQKTVEFWILRKMPRRCFSGWPREANVHTLRYLYIVMYSPGEEKKTV